MRLKILKWILLIALVIVSLFFLAPIVLMIINSFKSSAELSANSWGLPKVWTFENYISLVSFNSGIIVRTFFNSVYITVTYTVLTLIVSSLAAYVFSKLKFKGGEILFVVLLATMMIPREITMPAIFLMFSKFKMLNTYTIQIVPGIANVFCLFMLRQYMDSLPDSLLEAATLDGANRFQIFWRVVLPLTKPALGAMAILTFLEKWNDYLWPSVLLTKKEVMPIMVILPNLNVGNSQYAIPWNLIMTGCAIVTLPLIVVFLIFQEQFMSSVTIGAVKE